ncbi:hypothetical protein [Rhodopirellula halodulae]|uniref:hypothetical protein n=1 Tax=Rhodopirellula halodulae TaxID=2894198 RepID=UPI001E309FE1|nr:hypothetical protein [Rhodopirellula sp. JC737]MCC9658534.1 hypothetical protein [Rhodopirellula sp. JC737]
MTKFAFFPAWGFFLITFICWMPTAVADESAAEVETDQERGTIRFEFSGSYNVVIDGKAVAWGEGSTTIELKESWMDRISGDGKRSIQESNLVMGDVIDGIASLPATIRSANETLKMLSDPETQKALKQVESLLRLLPKATPVRESSPNSDADPE